MDFRAVRTIWIIFRWSPRHLARELEEFAGEGSPLARKHGVFIHSAGIASMPENYEERLVEVFPGFYANIRFFVPDPYDLVLSKINRNGQRDREDVEYLAHTRRLEAGTLRERYEKELRASLTGSLELHDQTLELWIAAYFAK